MSTNTEKQAAAPEEYLADIALGENNNQFRTVLTSGIITRSDGVSSYISYNPNDLTTLKNNILLHPTVPTQTSFDKNPEAGSQAIFSGVSNAYKVLRSGITDFTAYNDYIHYDGSNKRWNVMPNLVRSTFHFQMYGNQFR